MGLDRETRFLNAIGSKHGSDSLRSTQAELIVKLRRGSGIGVADNADSS